MYSQDLVVTRHVGDFLLVGPDPVDQTVKGSCHVDAGVGQSAPVLRAVIIGTITALQLHDREHLVCHGSTCVTQHDQDRVALRTHLLIEPGRTAGLRR